MVSFAIVDVTRESVAMTNARTDGEQRPANGQVLNKSTTRHGDGILHMCVSSHVAPREVGSESLLNSVFPRVYSASNRNEY
jgi:hypothetical protein